MSAQEMDYESPCPGCEQPIGDHTFRDYKQCLDSAGFDYVLPYEDVVGGPLHFDAVEGELVGEVTVAAAVVESPLGRMPSLRFTFTGPGPTPMSRRSLPHITLVMDANGLKSVRQLVSTSVDKAILAARRGR